MFKQGDPLSHRTGINGGPALESYGLLIPLISWQICRANKS